MGDTRFVEPFQRLRSSPELARESSTFDDDDLVQALAGNARELYIANIAASELQNRLRRKNAILDAATECLCSLDESGHILFMNRAAEQTLLGMERARQGSSFHDLVHAPDPTRRACKVDCPFGLALRVATRVRVEQDQFTRIDGTHFDVSYSVDPVIRDAGVEGYIVAFHDVTETQRMSEAAARREERLAQALRWSHIGRWDWDIVHDALFWSEDTHRAVGVDPTSATGGIESYFQRIPPSELHAVKEALRDALREAGPFDIIHHMMGDDARERRIRTRGAFTFKPGDDIPVAAWGTYQDLSDDAMDLTRVRAR